MSSQETYSPPSLWPRKLRQGGSCLSFFLPSEGRLKLHRLVPSCSILVEDERDIKSVELCEMHHVVFVSCHPFCAREHDKFGRDHANGQLIQNQAVYEIKQDQSY